MKYLVSLLFVSIFLFTSTISVAQSAKIKTVQTWC
jgi:hypothetical protein